VWQFSETKKGMKVILSDTEIYFLLGGEIGGSWGYFIIIYLFIF
jgi:hypothetical protein